MFNLFSGGALSRFTIFALGIMPYISASIIMQLMTVAVPRSSPEEGRRGGRRKITQYTRYGTLVLACFRRWASRLRSSRSRAGARSGADVPLRRR
jgi:preprotein translocase subunit SecY